MRVGTSIRKTSWHDGEIVRFVRATSPRMKRRTLFLFAAGVGAATAWDAVLAASDNPRVGFIGIGARQPNQHLLGALRDGLQALGWSEASITLLDRWAEGHGERLPGIASELIGSGVDILVTAGTSATLATTKATTALPIVFVAVGDPRALGIVESLPRPGGNVTGLSLRSSRLIATRLNLLRELLPVLRRLAVIVRNEPGLEQTLQNIRSNAHGMGIDLMEFEVATGATLKRAFMHLQNDRCDAIYVAAGPLGPAKRADIIELAAQAHLPAIYSYRIFADNRGLMSYAVDERELFRRAATIVDKILKGAKPGDLPVEEPTKFELVINLQTAKALGLTVPQSLLQRADEVIE
jgi:putative ABC transport system substrate-binding protein